MIVGVPTETFPGEHRVALIPSAIPILKKQGFNVVIEKGAGNFAGFSDQAYQDSGATLSDKRPEIFKSADIIVQVRGLGTNPDAGSGDLQLMRPNQTVIGFLEPLRALVEAENLADAGVTSFAIEFVPRIARAQTMDALTSMATVTGYKAVILAATSLGKLFPMLVTAAGTLTPARVFIVGAGVAGLQAVATARRLGAIVQVYDIRSASKGEVESLGARFVELPLGKEGTEEDDGYANKMDDEFYERQRELMGRVISKSDVVITTAAVPGAKAPTLLTDEMVKGMPKGSVIVDLAAETGGNCVLTVPGETIMKHGVTIIGETNIPATMPNHASQMFSKNMVAFLLHVTKDGSLDLDIEDDIIRETLLTHNGKVVNAKTGRLLGLDEFTNPTKEETS